MLDHSPNRQCLFRDWPLETVVNRHRPVHEELKQNFVAVHSNTEDGTNDDGDGGDGDDDAVVVAAEFEENVELIDTLRVVLMKAKSQFHCLEREGEKWMSR